MSFTNNNYLLRSVTFLINALVIHTYTVIAKQLSFVKASKMTKYVFLQLPLSLAANSKHGLHCLTAFTIWLNLDIALLGFKRGHSTDRMAQRNREWTTWSWYQRSNCIGWGSDSYSPRYNDSNGTLRLVPSDSAGYCLIFGFIEKLCLISGRVSIDFWRF